MAQARENTCVADRVYRNKSLEHPGICCCRWSGLTGMEAKAQSKARTAQVSLAKATEKVMKASGVLGTLSTHTSPAAKLGYRWT